ncbi:MAG: malic enzyme-like NAD(P)-binding protein, partial [Anaerovoracaceae bacterium]|nr:malic enzyme-like NAD(P)-binding protein [Anaerovoracaceae bacterium]
MDYYKKALELHEENMGKWAVSSKVPLNDRDDLSTAYTPGVAQPCREIEKDYENIYRYTSKQNTVAVITDGSAVLGLGNIGADASIPVMEGKAVLFKGFAGIDALPICIKTQDVDEFCNIVKNISSTFGGINLEDISAPRCFEIENRLKRELNIPVFHDDQHGTAVVVSAAAINALKLIGKKMEDCTAVIAGAGAAGTAIARMLVNLGIKDILVCGRDGIICSSSPRLNDAKRDLLKVVNREDRSGSIHDAMEGADIFIGVSAPKLITADDVRKMADSPVVFAMSNPEPEIMPDEAAMGGAAIIGTGRS